MTGFGAGSASDGAISVRVELRSVNHRGLDIRFRMPSSLVELQPELAAALRQRELRGHVDILVELSRNESTEPTVRVDTGLARAWQRSFAALAHDLQLAEGPTLALIVAQPGVAQVARPDDDAAAIGATLRTAFAEALYALIASREAEGARLADDLHQRLVALATLREEIADLAEPALRASHERLHERVAALIGGERGLDATRLELEIALIADRTDLTEELVRLDGHLHACRVALNTPSSGRKLGFLVQELLREINTIGSKCSSLAITERVVAAKVEIEKIREQVLNLS